MESYKSIETLYKRDKATNKLDFNLIRVPEWNYISEWFLTEKIDGTNIRVIVETSGISIKGRTDNAQVAGDLKENILKMFPSHEKVLEYFKKDQTVDDDWSVTFYGEGYGPGIKGSESMNYRGGPKGEKSFRCFDVLFNNKYWATMDGWLGITTSLHIPITPVLGKLNELPIGRDAAVSLMSRSLNSIVAKEDSNTDIFSEGIVARPILPLFDRYGNRIIFKLTNREFK